MQAIMEPLFEIPYLVGVVTLGILILRKAAGRKAFLFFGIMAIVLGCGDAFHLVPRMAALLTTGDATLPMHAAALGFGKMVTSITMTVFYVILYHVWCLRYQKGLKNGLTLCVYLLAAARIILCLMPQNRWLDVDAPLSWGIYRNLPFAALGLLLIVLFFRSRQQEGPFRLMWLAIALSFAFYLPVVLFADAIPLMGMLMIPKTCAYVWIVWMGYRAVKQGEAA